MLLNAQYDLAMYTAYQIISKRHPLLAAGKRQIRYPDIIHRYLQLRHDKNVPRQ